MLTSLAARSPRSVGEVAEGRLTARTFDNGDIAFWSRQSMLGDWAWAVHRSGLSATAEASTRLLNLEKQQALSSMLEAGTVAQVSTCLSDAGVDALVYKGLALAVQTTGQWIRRNSADVDVLVNPRHVREAHEALTGGGLHRRDGVDGTPGPFLRFRECERAYSGLHRSIDLHWRVDSSPGYMRCSFEELWDRRSTVDVGGCQVATLDSIDALLVTAVHGSRERWSRWRWALDAYRQFALLDPAQWPAVVTRARSAGSTRSLTLALAVARECGLQRDWLPVPHAPWQATAAEWLAAAVAEDRRSPARNALARRRGRWQIADRRSVALDATVRSSVRQIFPESRTFM